MWDFARWHILHQCWKFGLPQAFNTQINLLPNYLEKKIWCVLCNIRSKYRLTKIQIPQFRHLTLYYVCPPLDSLIVQINLFIISNQKKTKKIKEPKILLIFFGKWYLDPWVSKLKDISHWIWVARIPNRIGTCATLHPMIWIHGSADPESKYQDSFFFPDRW